MAVYGYLRVSSQKQDEENQKSGILIWAQKNGIIIDQWYKEKIQGTKEIEIRQLGILINKLKPNDTIIISEFTRLARTQRIIFTALEKIINKGVNLYSIKEGYHYKNDISSKVIASTFALSSELEHYFIRERSKESRQRRKAEGKPLGGMPKGKVAKKKLDPHKEKVKTLISRGYSDEQIAKRFGVGRITVLNYRRFLGMTERNFMKVPIYLGLKYGQKIICKESGKVGIIIKYKGERKKPENTDDEIYIVQFRKYKTEEMKRGNFIVVARAPRIGTVLSVGKLPIHL